MQEARDAYDSVAPHSGALWQDQHRKKPAKGYPGQSFGHDEGRKATDVFASQLGTGDGSSVDDARQARLNLNASLHMMSSYLHTSAPGVQLQAGLTGGYSTFSKYKGFGDPDSKKAFASDIGERREQVKANIMDIVEHHVAPEDRATFSYPSPRREPMEFGGHYMTPPSSPFPEPLVSEPQTQLTHAEVQKKVLSAMVPLVEPTWQPQLRTQGQRPTPFYGSDVDEVTSQFTAQSAHTPSVGHAALEHYKAGTTPADDEVRVSSATSSAFFGTKSRGQKGAGLHEVVTTDSSPAIAANPNRSARIALGTAQGSVRTNTALTFFRAPSSPDGDASGSDSE